MKLTKGVGAHHVFDKVGVNEIEKCFNCVAPGSVITTIGFLGGKPKAPPNVPLLALGISVGNKQQSEDFLRFAKFSQIKPRVDRVFPFEQAIEAALQYLV
ncbi:hypothetical protein PENSPDRAFT_751012 [Peniophora sp. CONT]|nr:hypothetical protein PENSPDRAFT_751012 [Peniophora sp. CONT]